MHSKSCLALCLPLSAFMILLFWFLKYFGCSVNSQPMIGFDTLTRCSHSRVMMFQSGWMGSKADKWQAGWEDGALCLIPYLGAGTRSHSSVPERRGRVLAPSLETSPSPWKSPGGAVGSELGGASLQHIWQQGRALQPVPCERECGQEFKGRDYPLPSVSSCRVQFQALPAQEEHQKPAVSSVKGCLELWYL